MDDSCLAPNLAFPDQADNDLYLIIHIAKPESGEELLKQIKYSAGSYESPVLQ
jgi:hypothetical protein